MERKLANMLQNGTFGAKYQILSFFICSTEWEEKTDFEQLVINLSNETGNTLWYNYTVNSQNWISLVYCHLNLFILSVWYIVIVTI